MYMSSKRVNDLLVGLCLGISFMVRNEMIPFVNKDDSYYIMTFIIALAFIKWMINGFHINIKNRRNILEIGMQYSVIPKIIIYVYSIVIILAGLSEMRYLSSNIQTFINGLSAIAAFYLLDESIFKVSAYAVVVGYFGNIIIRIFNGTLFSKSFEYHDLAFSVGYIVIFIVMTKNKWTYKKFSSASYDFVSRKAYWYFFTCNIYNMVIFCYKTIRKKSKMLDNNYRCGYDVGLLSIGLSGFEPRLEPNSIEFKYRFGWKKLLLCCNAELCTFWNRFYWTWKKCLSGYS